MSLRDRDMGRSPSQCAIKFTCGKLKYIICSSNVSNTSHSGIGLDDRGNLIHQTDKSCSMTKVERKSKVVI